jgi:hypothetical protein
MNDSNEKNATDNAVGSTKGITGPKKDEIVSLELRHFFRADERLGVGAAEGLGVNIREVMSHINIHGNRTSNFPISGSPRKAVSPDQSTICIWDSQPLSRLFPDPFRK